MIETALIEMLLPLKKWIHIIRSNNKEFVSYQTIASYLNIDYYFYHPYTSRERGLNENTNGLIRQFFQKEVNLHILHKLKLLMLKIV